MKTIYVSKPVSCFVWTLILHIAAWATADGVTDVARQRSDQICSSSVLT